MHLTLKMLLSKHFCELYYLLNGAWYVVLYDLSWIFFNKYYVVINELYMYAVLSGEHDPFKLERSLFWNRILCLFHTGIEESFACKRHMLQYKMERRFGALLHLGDLPYYLMIRWVWFMHMLGCVCLTMELISERCNHKKWYNLL